MAGETAGPEGPVTGGRPGVVFDCVVFVQALARRKGPAAACKELIDQGRAALFMSPAILAEVGEVLRRPKIQQKLLRLRTSLTLTSP
jgi:predicted nucleic acid-binding protein